MSQYPRPHEQRSRPRCLGRVVVISLARATATVQPRSLPAAAPWDWSCESLASRRTVVTVPLTRLGGAACHRCEVVARHSSNCLQFRCCREETQPNLRHWLGPPAPQRWQLGGAHRTSRRGPTLGRQWTVAAPTAWLRSGQRLARDTTMWSSAVAYQTRWYAWRVRWSSHTPTIGVACACPPCRKHQCRQTGDTTTEQTCTVAWQNTVETN